MTVQEKPWNKRQSDFANYFNPAYLGLLSTAVVRGYTKTNTEMPLSLLFPAIPMLLHPEVKSNLPKNSAARLSKWLRENPNVQLEILSATTLLVPQVKEGILTALRSRWLKVNDVGFVTADDWNKLQKSEFKGEFQRAHLVGKWLARSGTELEIYRNIGIRP